MTSKRPDTDQEQDERTTDVGLYHFARSYRLAADYLEAGPSRNESTHPNAPRDFLYMHAIELYLKAFLRAKGHGVADLKDIGHDAQRLAELAFRQGAVLDTDGRQVIELMTPGNVFGARYIKTGAYRRPSTISLKQTAEQLHGIVWACLNDVGVPCAG